jgi:predicted Zn-dependent protease
MKIPVFKLNFYLMGQDIVDESITLEIGANVEYLNEEFEGAVRFELNQLFMDSRHAYIPDLHRAALGNKSIKIANLIGDIEEKGSINIFLFDTYSQTDEDKALMGFTPILNRKQSGYESKSPLFDRIFIAYPGLSDKSTIVHEMGHFLGLSHPWDMSSIDRELMGLTTDESQGINHMTYNYAVSEFTSEQLDRMQHFALNFRNYLLSKQE